MSRNYNFCAGPAALPNEVLDQLKAEIPDWQGKGLSVMEMSHRSKEFVEIAETAKQDFIDLLEINDDYEVLFIQGGASLQFSMMAITFPPPGASPLCDMVSNADVVGTGDCVA